MKIATVGIELSKNVFAVHDRTLPSLRRGG
jgi:hypothetical protein